MSGATRIDSATNGLSVTVGDDGAWVEFTTQTGKHFCFQPAQEFCGRGGIGGDAVRDWCLEMQTRRMAPKPEDSTASTADAAPDMLEALRVLAEIPVESFGKESKPDYPLMGWNDHTLKVSHVLAARAAIAKATGAA